ncbi:MAG TPA: hypothetical protein DD645_07635, partial [Olsenella sp.]|nr:hypothetical protein [Olsenella sp.]
EGDSTADGGDSAADAGDSASGDASQDAGDAAQGADGQDEPTPEETVVEVSVASGQVSWVEITCDGESVFVDSVTGPWTQSYTVHDSINVQVTNPDVVTVTENGERRDFSERAGGLGSLTIEGTPLPEEGDATSGEGADSGTTSGSAGA